jgi:predicted permease
MSWFEGLLRDFRYVVRGLWRSPAFSLTVIATLAVGIGVNAAVFTVTNATLFGGFPLVVRNDRIVYLTTTQDAVYYPDFAEWRAGARSFEDAALARNVYSTLSGADGSLDTYFTTEVTANAFALLGVRPILGRDFVAADAQPGAAPVALLRYELWERRFAANPAVVGQSVRINGAPTTVIGVMPRGFSFPTDQDLWTPLVPTAAALRREGFYARYAFARLAEGATIDKARAEIETIGTRLASTYPATNHGVVPVVQTFAEWSVGPKASLLYRAASAAVGFVLLIVCANMANLLLGRALQRSRHVAIRLALGASRARIGRHFLLESLTLCGLGGLAGAWLAKIALRAYALTQPHDDIARVLGYAMNWDALAYLTAATLGCGLVVGLAASAGLANLNADRVLRGSRSGIARGRLSARVSQVLVASQMALAVVLLASAGVLIRSFVNIATADVGIGVDAGQVLSMSLYVPPERYGQADAQVAFYRELGDRLAALPGVEAIGFGTAAPADFVPRLAYELEGAPAVEGQARPTVSRFASDAVYFAALGVRLVGGRAFDGSDRASSLPVAIVNERFASMHWPAQSAIGKRLRLFSTSEPTPWLTVVGVAANVVQNDRSRQSFEPLVYVPYEQNPQPNLFALARTSVAPNSLANAFRREVYALDPDVPVPALWPLAERFDRTYAFERRLMRLFVGFAGIALLLAAVGLYASVSRAVDERTHEIGVRTALGATLRDVRALVLASAAAPVTLGLVTGLVASFAVNASLASGLVRVSAGDPTTLIVAAVVLVVSAMLGCVVPARRAARVDPVIALRHD